jgi:hypothetical protein
LLGTCANLAGEMVLSAYPWQQFHGDFMVTGNGVVTTFPIPDDYHRLIDDTGWSYAMRRPCRMITQQQWSYMKAWVSGAFTLQPIFRLVNNQFEFFNPPMMGEQIKFQYIRKNWVIDGETPTTVKEFCTKNADTPMFDWLLMVLALKVKWREIKGFDTAADMADFSERVAQLTNKDIPGQTLSLNGAGIYDVPFLSGANLPITGYGE